MKFRFRFVLLTLSLFSPTIPSIAWAQLDKGVAAYTEKDYATLVSDLRLLAAQGDIQAQSGLGLLYEKGLGVQQDFSEAVKWYQLAADQGFVSAQVNLGFMYAIGEEIPQDFKESIRWFLMAARQGHTNAQYMLGDFYAKGLGVSQDDTEAMKWYRLAADQGDAGAQSNIAEMYTYGRGVTSNRVVAYALYNLLAGNNASIENKAIAIRDKLAASMNSQEIEAAQNLTREIAKQGNFLMALDNYTKNANVNFR